MHDDMKAKGRSHKNPFSLFRWQGLCGAADDRRAAQWRAAGCRHSVLRLVLTLQISRVIETLIFRLEWVVGITPYAQFCPIPSPLTIDFFKKLLLIYKKKQAKNSQKSLCEKMEMWGGGRNWKKLNIGGDSYDPSQSKNQYLYNSRNLEGQNQSQHTVTYNDGNFVRTSLRLGCSACRSILMSALCPMSRCVKWKPSCMP